MAPKKRKTSQFSSLIQSSKYPNGIPSESESDEEEEVIFFKKTSFFNKKDSFKFGNFKIKLAVHPTKFSWHCFMKKINSMNRTSKYGDSFIIFPAHDIEFVIDSVKRCARKVVASAIRQDDIYGDPNPNAYKTQEFWHSEHSEITPSSQLIIRPFTDSNGSYFVKFLSPKSLSEYEDWLGSSVSMNVPLCQEFLQIIEFYYNSYKLYIENYQENLKQTQDAEESITFPSPTKDEICAVALKKIPGPAVQI
jgi:hypothetical protein